MLIIAGYTCDSDLNSCLYLVAYQSQKSIAEAKLSAVVIVEETESAGILPRTWSAVVLR